MTIDRKQLAEKLLQLLREEGNDAYIGAEDDLKDVTLDGWWNLERVAEKLAGFIESQDATSQYRGISMTQISCMHCGEGIVIGARGSQFEWIHMITNAPLCLGENGQGHNAQPVQGGG